MKPYSERVPDSRYKNTLKFILNHGEMIQDTPQNDPALTYMFPPHMRFKYENGAPVLTERKIGFWRKPIAEIIAFINGKHRLSELEEMGCNWWSAWATPEKCAKMRVEPGDLGPGSYGPAFHDFPMPDGKTFNQVAHVVDQGKKYPHLRTLRISTWIPFYIGRGADECGFWTSQRAVVSPCHGDIQLRIHNGKLTMGLKQRSADVPIGVPANMIQYFALFMMIAQVWGLEPYEYVHILEDAHIYQKQLVVGAVEKMVKRESRPLPTLRIKNEARRIRNIFEFRPEHFELSDYHPHPAIKDIPVLV